MVRQTIFLFGEAERGEFCTPQLCKSLPQLSDVFGNPPDNSQGILYAVQALLYERDLIFFRVKEEGFSSQDYMKGIKLFQSKEFASFVHAICMPGVGNAEIIEATEPVCRVHKTLLVISEQDLYDYLTDQ